ncbi:MAG: 3-methyl-2-oxobutanoate hydroxymethyltransferase, partial [Salinibacterium sp.]|nr:3-methyl-2-oxobutanoate hydroxymethyltransferase [Salinibacterium sp.]
MSLSTSNAGPEAITIRTLRSMASARDPFACLAVYDATMARLMDEAGVHALLAGDSAAEVVLGLPRTVHMPLDFAIHITAAVRRGASRAHVMADMPFMS